MKKSLYLQNFINEFYDYLSNSKYKFIEDNDGWIKFKVKKYIFEFKFNLEGASLYFVNNNISYLFYSDYNSTEIYEFHTINNTNYKIILLDTTSNITLKDKKLINSFSNIFYRIVK